MGKVTALVVRISNDGSTQVATGIEGTGRGLAGLRERVQEIGGSLVAGLGAGGRLGGRGPAATGLTEAGRPDARDVITVDARGYHDPDDVPTQVGLPVAERQSSVAEKLPEPADNTEA